MKKKIFVFDPTANDELSRVRGIGRYMQILRENFEKEFIFTSHLTPNSYHPTSSIFINPFFNFLKPPLLMKRIAQKQIAIIHDLIPLKYPAHFPIGIKGKLNVFLNKLTLKNYDLIITDSEASKKDIVNILSLPEEKIKVIYPCLPKIFSIPYSEFRIQNINTKYRIPNTEYCLYVGDATWNKNLVNLARAIKEINMTCVFVGKVFENLEFRVQNLELKEKKISNFKIDSESSILNSKFLSHPWQQEFHDFLKEVKDDKRFIFAGFLPDEQLINLYQQARCNILPSRDEGFGFSYLESASQGCPSVLADIPVLKEISNGNALFTDPNNVSDMANIIGELYFNEITRKQIGQKALKRSRFFSSSQFKKSFLKLLKEL